MWKNRNLYELYEEAHTPWEWHEALYKCAADNNIIIFSTPFDDSAVEFLEKINLPINLLRISVGIENIEEIKKEFEKLNTI